MAKSRASVQKRQTGAKHPATKHAAHAEVLPARVSEKARAVAAEIAVAAPVRDSDGGLPVHDQEVVKMLATVLCRLDSLGQWLDKNGSLDRRGKVRSAANWERRLQSQALRFMKELGLTPSSRAKLGLNLAKTVDLAQAMSHPDPQRRAELMAEAGLDVETDA
jgi:hypothetical protein